MSLLTRLLTGVRNDAPAWTLRECRHCGQAVDDDTDSCPTCGAIEIAVYEIE